MAERTPNPEKLRVLIVEDDRITSADLEATLQRLGHSVAGIAETGREALTVAEAEKPDLALLDIRLAGDLDGIEAAREMRRRWQIPVVFLTGYSADAVFVRAREAQPAGYLRKPFGDGELAACMTAAIEKSRVQVEYRERETPLRQIVAGLDEAVIAADADGKVTIVNTAAEQLIGWIEAEAIGKPLREIAPIAESENEDGEGAVDPLPGNGERPLTLETKSGVSLAVRERSLPIRNESGDLLGIVTIFRKPESVPDDQKPSDEPMARASALDRARKLANQPSFRELIGGKNMAAVEGRNGDSEEDEDEEEESSGLSSEGAGRSSLVEEISDPLLTFNDDWEITYANAGALACFGGKAALIGRDFWEVFNSESRERYQDEFRRPIIDGRRHSFQFRDNERERWLEVDVYRSGDGILALFRDISVRKQAEADALRIQRLEGLGLLARGFAHDFNNLLTVLIGNLDLSRERYPDDREFQEDLENAEEAAGHARNLVQQLLTFAQGGRPIRETSRVADFVRQILRRRRATHPGIRYQFQCADPGMRVNLDRGQITRLIENLVTNAEQAMVEDGGTLIARCAIAGGEEVSRWKGAPVSEDEKHLVIEIIDTGSGMSETELERAFEPYFTTRTGANATGIGLTVCESIAKAHDGFIFLQSKKERGTIATFCMPIGAPAWADENASPVDSVSIAADDAPEQPHGSGRILVLEDDLQIRRLIAVTLRRDGHEIVETADGRDTVRVFREAIEAGRPFDLVLSDLTIEDGVGGVEAMRALRRLDPGVVAIVSSGYSDAPAMARPAAFGFTAVLPKPYPPRALRQIVNSVLARCRKSEAPAQQD